MEQSEALRTVSKWLNEDIGGKPPLQEMAELCAEMQMGMQLRVKLGNQYGETLNGHWFYLLPCDEYSRRALIEHTQPPNAKAVGLDAAGGRSHTSDGLCGKRFRRTNE